MKEKNKVEITYSDEMEQELEQERKDALVKAKENYTSAKISVFLDEQ